MHFSDRRLLLVLILGLLIPRIIVLLDPQILPDLDEAALGIHVQKWIQGTHVSFFFPGQTHSFVFPEMLLLAPLLAIFPGSFVVLKIVPLLFFLGAMILLFYAIPEHQRKQSVFLLLLISLLPTSIIWSMKLRGGYVPALFFCCLILWIRNRSRPGAFNDFFVGWAMAWMFMSHTLMAVFFVFPIAYSYVLKEFRRTEIFPGMIGMFVGFVFQFVGKKPENLFPPDTARLAEGFSLLRLPSDLATFIDGKWIFWSYGEVGWPTICYGILALIIIWSLFRSKGIHRLFISTMGFAMFSFYGMLQPFPLRYFVPFLFALFVFAATVPLPAFSLRCILSVLGLNFILFFLTPFYHTHLEFSGNSKAAIDAILSENKGMTSVFVEDESLAYLLHFRAREQQHFRAKPAYHRFQRDWYDGELAIQQNLPVGLVTQEKHSGLNPSAIIDQWHIYNFVSRDVLLQSGFELKGVQ